MERDPIRLHQRRARLIDLRGPWDARTAAAWSDGVLARLLRTLVRPTRSARLRILVADDDAEFRHWLDFILTREGYEVEHAEDGAVALARLAAGGIDLLLTDQGMPGTSGLMVLETARERWPGLPVIFVTADTSQLLSIQALRGGATDFVQKPLDRECLLLRIHRVLRAVEAEREAAQAHAVLAERDRMLHALFRNLPGMAYRCRRRGERLEMDFVSDGAAALTGFSPEELIGGDSPARFDAIVHPNDAWLRQEVRRQAKAGETFSGTFRIVDRMGRERWLLEKGSVAAEQDGTEMVVGFVTDITEQREREEALRAAEVARRIAEATSRTQSEFLDAVSHELRSPLHHILSYVGLLKEELAGQNREDLLRIEGAARRQQRLVDDLLDLSKLEAGRMTFNPEETDFLQVIDVAHSEAEALLAARRLVWRVAVETAATTAWIDSTRMVQVLVNLIANATRFSPEGGEITLSLADGELAGEPALCLRVRDRGGGIPPGKEEEIFDKFAQAHESHADGGTGLGLAICAEIVAMHRGRIWAGNHPEGGAVLTLLIPRTEPDVYRQWESDR